MSTETFQIGDRIVFTILYPDSSFFLKTGYITGINGRRYTIQTDKPISGIRDWNVFPDEVALTTDPKFAPLLAAQEEKFKREEYAMKYL